MLISLMVSVPHKRESNIVKGIPKSFKKRDTCDLKSIIDINNKEQDKHIRISAGINRIAGQDGQKNLSPYLDYAGTAFCEIVDKSNGENHKRIELESEEEIFKNSKVTDDLILLGGPVANENGGNYTGYIYEPIRNSNNLTIPIFNDSDLRWGYYCGDTHYGYGFYDGGENKTAKRCEGNKIVERPLYAIIDRESSGLKMFNIDKDGFLLEEVLLITKRARTNNAPSVFIIGGMHGYSIHEFSEEISLNTLKMNQKIEKKIGSNKSYQIYLPVELRHYLGQKNATKAILIWEKAIIITI